MPYICLDFFGEFSRFAREARADKGEAVPFFDHFDLIRIVNLPERADRRREMNRELSKIGLRDDPRVRYFAAIRPEARHDFTSIGARGVYESHKQLLREATEQNKSVLILEDDCSFRRDASDYVSDGKWDIFYGGYYATSPDDLVHSDIIGAHMMGFSKEGARRVSNYFKALEYEGTHPPIDAAYVWFRRAFPAVSTEFAIPPMAHQRSSKSDIAPPKPWDKFPGINALRRLRNHLSRR